MSDEIKIGVTDQGSIGAITQKFEKLEKAISSLAAKTQSASTSNIQQSKLQTQAIVDYTAKQEAMNKARQENAITLSKEEKALAAISYTMMRVGSSLEAFVSKPIRELAQKGLNVWMSQTKGIAEIQTLLNGTLQETTIRVSEYADELKKLSTRVNISVKDLSGGLYETISAFGETYNSIEQLAVAAEMAKAGVSSTKEAVDLLSSVALAYGDTSTATVQKIADLSFSMVKLTKTHIPEIAMSIKKAAPMAAELNVSIEELYASAGALIGVSGNTTEVFTQLRQMMLKLIKPTTELQRIYKSLGYESIDAGRELVSEYGLVGALQKISDAADNNGISLTKAIGNIRALQGVYPLLRDESSRYNQILKDQSAIEDASGDAFEKRMIGYGFSIETIQRQRIELENLQASLKEVGYAYEWVGNTTKISLLSGLSTMPKLIQQILAGLGMLAGSLGTIIQLLSTVGMLLSAIAIAKKVNAFQSIAKLLSLLKVGGPIIIGVIAITALIGGLVHHFNRVTKATEGWLNKLDEIKSTSQEIKNMNTTQGHMEQFDIAQRYAKASGGMAFEQWLSEEKNINVGDYNGLDFEGQTQYREQYIQTNRWKQKHDESQAFDEAIKSLLLATRTKDVDFGEYTGLVKDVLEANSEGLSTILTELPKQRSLVTDSQITEFASRIKEYTVANGMANPEKSAQILQLYKELTGIDTSMTPQNIVDLGKMIGDSLGGYFEAIPNDVSFGMQVATGMHSPFMVSREKYERRLSTPQFLGLLLDNSYKEKNYGVAIQKPEIIEEQSIGKSAVYDEFLAAKEQAINEAKIYESLGKNVDLGSELARLVGQYLPKIMESKHERDMFAMENLMPGHIIDDQMTGELSSILEGFANSVDKSIQEGTSTQVAYSTAAQQALQQIREKNLDNSLADSDLSTLKDIANYLEFANEKDRQMFEGIIMNGSIDKIIKALNELVTVQKESKQATTFLGKVYESADIGGKAVFENLNDMLISIFKPGLSFPKNAKSDFADFAKSFGKETFNLLGESGLADFGGKEGFVSMMGEAGMAGLGNLVATPLGILITIGKSIAKGIIGLLDSVNQMVDSTQIVQDGLMAEQNAYKSSVMGFAIPKAMGIKDYATGGTVGQSFISDIGYGSTIGKMTAGEGPISQGSIELLKSIGPHYNTAVENMSKMAVAINNLFNDGTYADEYNSGNLSYLSGSSSGGFAKELVDFSNALNPLINTFMVFRLTVLLPLSKLGLRLIATFSGLVGSVLHIVGIVWPLIQGILDFVFGIVKIVMGIVDLIMSIIVSVVKFFAPILATLGALFTVLGGVIAHVGKVFTWLGEQLATFVYNLSHPFNKRSYKDGPGFYNAGKAYKDAYNTYMSNIASLGSANTPSYETVYPDQGDAGPQSTYQATVTQPPDQYFYFYLQGQLVDGVPDGKIVDMNTLAGYVADVMDFNGQAVITG